MDECDEVERPEQHRQSLVKKNKSEIKQEKKMSKTESRFKSKLGKFIQSSFTEKKTRTNLFFFLIKNL